ncbi:Uncharacterized membrane protein YesL [Amphibacillus marinus]|uniref:Uncharacterized membrane protein YesL n=1 Tax=Amphibacillus marinus TaxID=872970 RepID=A0A1H8MME3_9BACI|nr:DUF624 domain-containing protein [Amphibacillus marinus]SEO18454.1 Uncharacterized membrane protein YesL [Amphibacillus marinus]SEO95265.1 Uncharacterized membrane protein YesL [Amphibacillus marinus]
MRFINSKFYAIIEFISNLFLLNLLWLIASLPLVTLFPATAAMHSVIRGWLMGQNKHLAKEFVSAFKSNLKQSFILSLLFISFITIFILNLAIIEELSPNLSVLVLGMMMTLAIIVGFVLVFAFPLMVHYTFTIKQLLKHALLYAFMYLPTTILSLTLIIFAMIACLLLPVAIIFIPALASFCSIKLCFRCVRMTERRLATKETTP